VKTLSALIALAASSAAAYTTASVHSVMPPTMEAEPAGVGSLLELLDEQALRPAMDSAAVAAIAANLMEVRM
jgi:hypothetical protein